VHRSHTVGFASAADVGHLLYVMVAYFLISGAAAIS
jgi:hypothetical protein